LAVSQPEALFGELPIFIGIGHDASSVACVAHPINVHLNKQFEEVKSDLKIAR